MTAHSLPSGGPRSHHLIDTNVKIAFCDRCEAPLWVCYSGGVQVLVDPKPLDGVSGWREAVLDGRPTYKLTRAGGRPWRLQSVHSFTALERSELFVAHIHPTAPFTLLEPEVPDTPEAGMLPVILDPPRHPATSGVAQGGNHNDANAPSYVDLTPVHATPATLRRSEELRAAMTWRPSLCCICRQFFEPSTEYVSWYVSPSQWWAAHAEPCPSKPRKVRVMQGAKK